MDLARVIETARTASEKDYSPYSNFRVGEVILTEGGTMYAGYTTSKTLHMGSRSAQSVSPGGCYGASQPGRP
jgi:cytidine deaminase